MKKTIMMCAIGMTIALTGCKKHNECKAAGEREATALQHLNMAETNYANDPSDFNKGQYTMNKQQYTEAVKARTRACD